MAEAVLLFIDRRRRAGLVVAALLIAALGAVAVRRNAVWRNDSTLVVAMAKDAPQSARGMFAVAGERASHGDCRGAISGFQRALALFPPFWEARLRLAACYEHTGEPDAARREFSRLLHDDPADALAAHRIINICIQQNNWGCIAQTMDTVLHANPETAGESAAWFTLGDALLREGRLREAETALRRALALQGTAIGHFELGDVLSGLGRSQEAAFEYRAARWMGMEVPMAPPAGQRAR